MSLPRPALLRLWLGAIGLALCGACQSGVESAQVEPPPSRLATRIDRMLDDPSQLPSVAPAAAEGPDASGAGADAAVAADDGTGAADTGAATVDAAGGESDTAAVATAEAKADETKAAATKADLTKAAEAPVQPAPAAAATAKVEAKPADAAAQAKSTKPEAKPETRVAAKPEAKSEPKAEPKPKAPAEPAPETAPAAKPEGDATDLYYSGKRKLDAGDLRGAIEDLKASQAIRYSVRTLTLLGRAYFDLGEFGPAAKALQKAGTYDEAMLLLAQLYQQQGKNAQARKVYEQFLKVHADHPKAAWVKRIVEAL